MEVGIMRDPRWDSLGAIDLARELDADLGRMGSSASQCAILADIEYHDFAQVLCAKIVAKNKHGHGDATIRWRIGTDQQDLQFRVILTLQFSLPCFGNSLT